MFSFSIFSFLSYNYFINSFSFSSYGLVSLLIFSYLLFISSSNCRFKLTILSSDIWINYRSYFFSFLNFNNSSSCNFFIFCMVSNKSAISLSLALLKEWNFFFSSSKNACDLCFWSAYLTKVCEVSSILVAKLVTCYLCSKFRDANFIFKSCTLAFCFDISISNVFLISSLSCKALYNLSLLFLFTSSNALMFVCNNANSFW